MTTFFTFVLPKHLQQGCTVQALVQVTINYRNVSFSLSQDRMQSSGHRLRDVEQHQPLLNGGEEEVASGRVWFIQDSCGMVCAFMTWSLVMYAQFVVNFVMLLPSKSFWYSLINGVAFNFMAVLALTSHLRTMLSDPVRDQGARCFFMTFLAFFVRKYNRFRFHTWCSIFI